MEGFVVSARKYRPDKFDAVVGQSHVTNTLKNALVSDQLAHAFLFSGPRGVGKTTCARILAKSINCMNLSPEGDPCNTCDSCKAFIEGKSMNIHELDAASNNSVEDIRKIIEQVRYVPTTGKKSVFIIDEVHMLSQSAFNAFLKTLEEPPPHAVFILATTEKHKILPTILSRCQKFDFRRIKVDHIAGHLEDISKQEDISYEYDGLQLVALKADGALRDALSIYDQIVSYSGRNITYEVVLNNLNVLDYDYFFKVGDLMTEGKHQDLLLMLNEILEKGFDVKDFLVGLVEHFRNLLVAQTPQTLRLLETSDNIRQKYIEQAQKLSGTLLLNAFQLTSDAEQKLRSAVNPRLLIELTLIKLAHLGSAIAVVAAGPEKKKQLAPQAKKQAAQEPRMQPVETESAVPQAFPEPERETPPVRPPVGQEPALTGETPPVRQFTPPPPVEAIPPENQQTSLAEPVLAGNAQPPVPQEKPRRRKSSFAIPTNLNEVPMHLPGDKAGQHAEAEEEKIAYDTSVTIDPDAFAKAFQEIKQWLQSENKYSTASCMREELYRLDHNKWIQSVENEISFKQLSMEKEIVQRMRELLNLPNLRLEIEINKEYVNRLDSLPYTSEEKLHVMKEKNPELVTFMQKFDAMVQH